MATSWAATPDARGATPKAQGPRDLIPWALLFSADFRQAHFASTWKSLVLSPSFSASSGSPLSAFLVLNPAFACQPTILTGVPVGMFLISYSPFSLVTAA